MVEVFWIADHFWSGEQESQALALLPNLFTSQELLVLRFAREVLRYTSVTPHTGAGAGAWASPF